MADLFDDPGPPPEPPKKIPRGDFTTTEKKQGILDLKDAMECGDDVALCRSMALSLYRLGAEPLNKLAVQILESLKGSV